MYKVASRALRIDSLLLACFAVLLLGMPPAFAIPSPELLVGSLSSISQVVSLVFAMLGGGAALVGARVVSKRLGGNNRGRIVVPVAIGVLFCLAASVWMNIHQYTADKAALQDRLEETLIRPTPLGPDGKPLDDLIREPAWEDQLTDPHGMTTAQVEKFMDEYNRGEHPDVIFGDIREALELEMGSPPGATPLRFADLSKGNFNFTQKKAVLVCHTGIRSYDMCQRLRAMGIDCSFMIGGIEKWLVERRPLTGYRVRTLKDLRALPAYPNQAVLLDTPDVRRLVSQDNAIFLDPRLPGEFAAGPLPGAINFTLRQTPLAQIPEKVNSIPKKPIIIPCYDRRSCFYGEALGLEMSRAGYDYRGRYTLPWDYFVKPKPRPFVQAWLNELNQTWWDKAVALMAQVVRYGADRVGFPLAILLLALASRLLVLPVSLKAERDQIVGREFASEVDAIKAKFRTDPQCRSREMRAFYARHKLTPVRNLIALLFLPVMAVCVAAVHAVAVATQQSLLWMPNAADRDHYFVLPVLFAALICIYLDSAFVSTRRHRLLVWLIGVPSFIALGAMLSGAADLYVVASVFLLLLQRAIVNGNVNRLLQAWRGLRRQDGVIPLSDVEDLSGCGNKAFRLAQMLALGIDVPNGVVLTSQFLERFGALTPQQRQRELDRLWRTIGAQRVAVRSSASGEDGQAFSFAGVFDSVLNVERGQLESAIMKVIASFDSERARGYGAEIGSKNILVQTMVDADYAGVLFTQDPASAGLYLVELVRGTADKLVSGSVRSQAFRYGRHSAKPVGTFVPPIDLQPLLEIGRRVEREFRAPQDIEWTYCDGQFKLVQSRDITTGTEGHGDADIQREWHRILSIASPGRLDEIVFAQNELSEVLPRPTPLSLSLMESLWASGGSVDLACRALNLTYPVHEHSPNYLVTVFGRLYVDKREERARALRINSLVLRRLKKSAAAIETAFREQFLAEFHGEICLLEATDFDRLATPELFDAVNRIRTNFIARTHVEVSIINIAADLYLRDANTQLAAAHLDPAQLLAPSDVTEFERVLNEARRAPFENRRHILAGGLGHRAIIDYELGLPRYLEMPLEMDGLAAVSLPKRIEPDQDALQKAGPALLRAVRVAQRFETLKEDAKHHSAREIAVLRRAILALDRRLGLDGLSFYLTFEELDSLRSVKSEHLQALASKRKALAAVYGNVAPLPARLTVVQLEDASAGVAIDNQPRDGKILGTRVSGAGIVEGRACVVTGIDVDLNTTIPGFRDGDIVVSNMVPPTWIPYFGRAGGFVCEIGSWLSHTAIVARERRVPLIVGTEGIGAISDGMWLRMHDNGIVEIVSPATAAVAAE
jgi:rhodanese-related sulfurtransferase/membrane protein insertase Oxa1/YidC/SpoIIIJ/phosphohistidine swiveling domain-containing protein